MTETLFAMWILSLCATSFAAWRARGWYERRITPTLKAIPTDYNQPANVYRLPRREP